ncbi:hypothetical protein NBRC10512_001067 [Rhodotorula toruloides]|uniref:RHTO0S06e10660g1_1 n=2 Tax=Rhodotorula toruloides TaxID=5286 RepID=A0A061B585_RHOTO|nr:SAGA-associated factor 29-like protein [Rhodotorula toruloides NP11]EMS19411.1 SAGA-associated factor 29-like protein [Rhodotorula toruloides NP11]CDR42178.1 RHTO0S06e10660g1_1 [Rhodotorula toruloides]
MAPVDLAQLTVQLRAQLKSYLAHSAAIASALEDANSMQTDVESGVQPLEACHEKLSSTYELILEQSEAEFHELDDCLNLLETLETAQNGAAAEAAKARAPPPNKKRKTDGSSRAGSPASSAAASPMPTFAGSPPNPSTPLPRPVAAAKAQPVLPSKSPAQHPLPIAPAPNPKKPTPKNRRDSLNAQLPLKPGRPIAVKESKKNSTTGQQPDNYILGRIVQQLQGDKNRYSVEDVDYDPSNPTPEGGKWNTTLKSIIPLPEKGDERTYPDYDFTPGMYVLACYPETTSFYRAIVHSGPHATSLGTGKKKETQKIYRLQFDDDEGALRDVPIELVCDPTPL